MIYDNTKLRLLELILETAKYCWLAYPSKKLQYIDDGLITHTYSLDTKLFAESQYGLYLSDGQNDAEMIQTIHQLAHAALQTDKARITDILTIFSDPSIQSMKRKLEASEEEAYSRQERSEKRRIEEAQLNAENAERLKSMEMEQTERIEMAKLENDLIVEEMRIRGKLAEAQMKAAIDKTAEKLALEYEKLLETIKLERDKLKQKGKETDKKISSQEKMNRQRISAQSRKTETTH